MNLNCVVAWLMWVGAVVLVCSGGILGVVLGMDGLTREALHFVNFLMCAGLALSAGAATVTVRAMITHQNRLLRDAFALGKASSGSVRQMR